MVSKMVNRLNVVLFFKRMKFVIRIFIIVSVLIDVQNYFFCILYVQVIRRTYVISRVSNGAFCFQ